ncbi:MAG: gluconeogenesis factor YvcK family protein [Patescibacteria group bacterium]
MKKKIIVFGGGNGSAITLSALKQNQKFFDIVGAISMCDSGGSSGKLREEFDLLPPGDIMRAVLSLSKYDYKILKDIFYSVRFENCGKLSGHNLGNLFLVLSTKYNGDFIKTLEAFSQSVGVLGKILPSTLEKTNLFAILENGQKIFSESAIDRPNYDRKLQIKNVGLIPEVSAYKPLLKEIEKADYLIIGPGSLYTSLIPALLPQGIFDSIKKSKAKLIYICGNAYEKKGETGPKIFSEVVLTLEKYLPRTFDLILNNVHKFTSKQTKFYQTKDWQTLVFDPEKISRKIMACDFEKAQGGLCPIKLGKKLKKIL